MDTWAKSPIELSWCLGDAESWATSGLEQGLGEWTVGSGRQGKAGLTKAVDLRVRSYPAPATDLEKVTSPPRTPFLCF